MDAKDISVSVDEGVVTLRGNVASYTEKIAAERVALRARSPDDYGALDYDGTANRPRLKARMSGKGREVHGFEIPRAMTRRSRLMKRASR